MKLKSGFSMLELVVVMLIMGTLAGIAISKMSGSDKGAIKASMKSDARSAIASINACYADKLSYQLCDTKAKVGGVMGADWSFTPSPDNVVTVARSTGKSVFPSVRVTNPRLTIAIDYTNTTGSITDTGTTVTGLADAW